MLLFLFLLLTPTAQAQLSCTNLFSADPTLELIKSIDTMTKQGKDSVRKKSYTREDQKFFLKIISIKSSDLQKMNSSLLLNIFSLFTQWNLLPPRQFQNYLFNALIAKIETWSANDFLTFALNRKLSPLKPSTRFMHTWKKSMLARFSKFNAKTQMEVFGAELFQQTSFTSHELRFLLMTTFQTLKTTLPSNQAKAYKELFRALLLLRTIEPTSYFVQMVHLEMEIERHLNSQSISLDKGGRSDTQEIPYFSNARLRFENRLSQLFPGELKIHEYSNSSIPGFYDPIDTFFPQLFLAVEWDGLHHYFNTVNADGSLLMGYKNLSLRPMDLVKDTILRKKGYRVLRIPPELSEHLDTLDILQLIEEQNAL